MTSQIDCAHIFAARNRIWRKIRRTPTAVSPGLSKLLGSPVHLKLEHHQITGSFKLRGVSNAIACLNEKEKARGVVSVSTGNHGLGLAFATHAAGVQAIVCMSEQVTKTKIEGIRSQGTEVRIVGQSQSDAQVEVNRLVRKEGKIELPPFDDPNVIAGQGTLGLEILEDMPELDTVVVPVSGGGLISGIACAIKACKPNVRVIGVSMERDPAMHASLIAGKPVDVEATHSLADALGGGIGLQNKFTFSMVRELVDELLLVSEKQIGAAVHHAYWKEKQLVEGAGAVGIAAVMAGKIRIAGITVVLVSGGNIDMELHKRIIDGEIPEL